MRARNVNECRIFKIDHFCRARYPAECTKSKTVVSPAMLIVDAGTYVGSSIKGHSHRGGKKMINQHGCYCTVGVTDEFRTSKVCIFFVNKLRLAWTWRYVKGIREMVSIHGALECANVDCRLCLFQAWLYDQAQGCPCCYRDLALWDRNRHSPWQNDLAMLLPCCVSCPSKLPRTSVLCTGFDRSGIRCRIRHHCVPPANRHKLGLA